MVENMENNIEFDSYLINDGEKDKIIYPLIKYKDEDNIILIYVENKEFKSMDEIFVAQIIDDEIVPIPNEDIDKYKKIVIDVYNELKKQS